MNGLARFAQAQDRVWPAVLAELGAGRKASHWMWFVFPQLRGLGRSATAEFYGIEGRPEAAAYLADPVLGPRLRQAAGLVLAAEAVRPEDIFGAVDALKLRSSMTLFDALEPGAVFGRVLERYYGGVRDPATLSMLG